MHIVFIPGFMGGAQEFLWLASSMPYPTEIISLPGHGCSDAEVTFNNVGAWLEEQLVGLKVKECILYGYSLGGRIALNYVLNHERHKVKINGLILESTNFGLTNKDQIQQRLKNDHEWGEKFRRDPLEKTLQAWYNQHLFDNLSPEDRAFLIKSKLKLDRNRLATCLEDLSLGCMPFFGQGLKNIELPLLYLYGELDLKFKDIATKILDYQNPHIQVREVKKAGHNCHFSNVGEVISHTKDFITQNFSTK